ncbi:MAG: winged helix-turn-helix domain-containing protein [Thermoprotei archaeon]
MKNETETIEKMLGSKSKIRILATLVKYREINIASLVKICGSGYTAVERSLKDLEKIGIITEKRFGRIRIIKLTENDKRVQALIKLFETLNKTKN